MAPQFLFLNNFSFGEVFRALVNKIYRNVKMYPAIILFMNYVIETTQEWYMADMGVQKVTPIRGIQQIVTLFKSNIRFLVLVLKLCLCTHF